MGTHIHACGEARLLDSDYSSWSKEVEDVHEVEMCMYVCLSARLSPRVMPTRVCAS